MKESPDQSPIPEGFSRYDTADYLTTEEDIAAYIEAVEEADDPVLMADALKLVAAVREPKDESHTFLVIS
ncbi:TPA: DNA-binding protein [Aeromonas hydrophila]